MLGWFSSWLPVKNRPDTGCRGFKHHKLVFIFAGDFFPTVIEGVPTGSRWFLEIHS